MGTGKSWRHRAAAGGLTGILVCLALTRTVSPQTPFALTQHTEPAGIRWQVNINEADAAHLEDLPGIGPVLAERIIAYREIHGDFDTAHEITAVSGIGEDTFRELEPYIIAESDS